MTNQKSAVVLMSLVFLFILFVALPATLIGNHSKENNTSTTNASSVDVTTPVYSEETSKTIVISSGPVYSEIMALYKEMKQKETPGDITKVLLPCEVGKTEQTNSEPTAYKTYIRILDVKLNESVSFEVGQIKGCDQGCDWSDKTCPSACSTVNLDNPEDWIRVEKTESNIVLNETATIIILLEDEHVTN